MPSRKKKKKKEKKKKNKPVMPPWSDCYCETNAETRQNNGGGVERFVGKHENWGRPISAKSTVTGYDPKGKAEARI